MRHVPLVLLLAAVPLTLLAAPLPAEASGYCPSQKNGKCPQPRKISKSRDSFTAGQREKLLEQARKICVKKYGATSGVYKFDYKTWTVICTEPGY